MKRILAVALIAIVVTALALTFVACSPAGTYQFASMKYTSGGVSVEYKAGEKSALGITVEATAATLELKKDGTYTFESTLPGLTLSEEGTWTKEGDTITFDDDFTATIDGKTLTAVYAGITVVMTK